MGSACIQEDHSSHVLNWICTNPSCKLDSLLCFKCLRSIHPHCIDNLFEIENINTRRFSQNTPWFQDVMIEDAIQFGKGKYINKEKSLESLK